MKALFCYQPIKFGFLNQRPFAFYEKKAPLKFLVALSFLAQILLLYSCANIPEQLQMPDQWALVTQNSRFNHSIFVPPTAQKKHSRPLPRLHVYIEGDGWPYINHTQVSPDPTHRNPISFHWMAVDPTPSINLGRPCYFQQFALQPDPNCSSILWTQERYSAAVVEDMVAALRAYLAKHTYEKVSLIGYSGGGTIAMLMAAQMPEVDQLVTVAANLDTDAWAQLQRYAPLTGSLNPVHEITEAQPKHQLHLAGDKDKNTPASLAQGFLEKLGLSYWVIADADHSCCWDKQWPNVLSKMEEQLAEPLPEQPPEPAPPTP